MHSPDELTPLAILLRCMREKWEEGDRTEAVRLASIAAPYLHPRVKSSAADARVELCQLSDVELAQRLDVARTRGSATEADPKQPG